MNASDSRLLPTRRSALAALGAGAASLLTGRAGATTDQARGRVFETGQRGRPLAGVMVSNGCDIALTDDDGRWSLPVASGDHVFVIEPPDWTANDGMFAYLHDGAASRSIDFSLSHSSQCRTFEALLFADTQAATETELGYVRTDLLSAAKGSGAAFALHHGDVMGDDLSLFSPYRKIVAETGLRWRHCPGNHDFDLDAADPALGLETWKREIGPTHCAFRHAGALFILLNNVDFLGRATMPDGRRYRGRICARQLRFIENVLRHTPSETLVVVSMHIPLASFDAPHSASDTTSNAHELLALLRRHPHAISFAGHSHTTEHHDLGRHHDFGGAAQHRHQVLTAASGSWWSGPPDARGAPISDSRDGSPRGYHVLEVDGRHAGTRFVALSADAPLGARVMLRGRDEHLFAIDRPIPHSAAQSIDVLVNVFDGRPATRVTLRCADHASDLLRSDIADPHVVESFERYRALCKPWVAAARSSHIWTGALPTNLSIGAHDISIDIETEGERIQTQTLRIEIA